MAPTEGRVARPERRWGCRRGNPCSMTAVVERHVVLYCMMLIDRSATLEVLAEDDHLHSSPVMTRVRVSVTDVNDNAPIIELMPSTGVTSQGSDVTRWRLNVTEHALNGTFVGHVTVSDADDAGNQRVTCSLRSSDQQHAVSVPC